MGKTSTSIQPIDQQQYSIWQGLYLAFFSPSFYVDVLKRWRGLGLRYLLLMMFCVTLPFSIRIGIISNQYFHDQIQEPLEKLPTFEIHEGKISFPHLMPYTITNQHGQVTAIVDTSGKITTFESTQYPHLSWLFTENTIEFKAPPIELIPGHLLPLNSSSFKEILDENVEDTFIGKVFFQSHWIIVICFVIFIMLVVGFWSFFVGLFGFITFGVALAGQFYAKVIFKEKISYSQAFRLLVVSLTVPCAILFILLSLGILIPQGGVYYLIIFSIYYSLGLLALRRANRQLVIV